MRLIAAALTLCFIACMAPETHALTVCPTSQFTIAFDPESDELDAGDIETLAAGASRARQCYVEAIELVVAGELEVEGSLAERRQSAVRDGLIHNGVTADLIRGVNESRESYGQRVTATPDAVIVLIFFDYGRPR